MDGWVLVSKWNLSSAFGAHFGTLVASFLRSLAKTRVL
jgi:hypothetical protein